MITLPFLNTVEERRVVAFRLAHCEGASGTGSREVGRGRDEEGCKVWRGRDFHRKRIGDGGEVAVAAEGDGRRAVNASGAATIAARIVCIMFFMAFLSGRGKGMEYAHTREARVRVPARFPC